MADFEVKFVEFEESLELNFLDQENLLPIGFSDIQIINASLPHLSSPGKMTDLIAGKQLIGEDGEVIEGALQNARATKF